MTSPALCRRVVRHAGTVKQCWCVLSFSCCRIDKVCLVHGPLRACAHTHTHTCTSTCLLRPQCLCFIAACHMRQSACTYVLAYTHTHTHATNHGVLRTSCVCVCVCVCVQCSTVSTAVVCGCVLRVVGEHTMGLLKSCMVYGVPGMLDF